MARLPMAHSLDGAYCKIQRAEEHIAQLDAEVQSFLNTEPYRVEREPDPKTERVILYARNVKQPPVRFGIIVGDVLHNLRSSLDDECR